jgi:hypothetical protein
MIQAVETAWPLGTTAVITGIRNANVAVFPSALVRKFGGRVTPNRLAFPYTVMTDRGNKGGVRYKGFQEYGPALEYAFKYARRVK